MKHLSLKKSVLVALVLLQCTAIVHSQAVDGGNIVAVPADVPSNNPAGPAATDPVNPPADPTPTTPAVVPTTTEEPKPTANPTTPPAPTTAQNPQASASDPSSPAETSDPTKPKPKPSNNNNEENDSDNSPNKPTDTEASANPTGSLTGGPTSTNTSINSDDDKENKETNNTAVIAGSVVGGLVGIALIAGLLTWLNRRGGCTSRTRRRNIQDDFDAHDNAYDLKMTDSHNMGAVAAGAAASGAVHSSDNLPPPSPFQHARRFVPPTSNPTGYMNLTDEEYGYHQQNTAYQPQGVYQEYNNSEYDYQQQQPHPEYAQHDYRNEYGQQQQDYVTHPEYGNEYQHEGSVNGSTTANGAGYQQAYYHTSSNLTSPTLTNTVPAALNDPYRQQLKPDQIEQKPNAA